MSNILSLQSHVAYGYVGNCVATFVLQRMGHEVVKINTVQFSNHSGYGKIFGDVMSLEHIDTIFTGLKELKVLDNIQGVLTGYMGDKALGGVLLKWLKYIKDSNPDVIYCCDPVIGDIGRGVFVKEGVGEFFRDNAARFGDIVTPNHFELSYLMKEEVRTIEDAIKACNILHRQGAKVVLVTSLLVDGISEDIIQMLVIGKQGVFVISTPKLPMPIPVNGAGDMTAAIFLASFLATKDVKISLEQTATKVYRIFEQTLLSGRRELALIQGQDHLLLNDIQFEATNIIF